MSLLEILVALTILSIVVIAAATTSLTSGQDKLEEALFKLEQSIKFASNEAILRGTIVRVKLDLDKEPIDYTVEYGPKERFVLPNFANKFEDEAGLSNEEIEERNKVLSNISKQFNKVPEFEEQDLELSEDVKILGIATSVRPGFINESEASIFIYPTGERDDALIVIATDEEVASLQIEPFSNRITRKFYSLNLDSGVEPADLVSAKAKEVYESWKR